MLEETLVADLVADLPSAVRLQRLVNTMRTHFGCSAVALLQLQQEQLKPVAVCGLASETLGRRFMVAHHPRLATILQSRQPVHFAPDSSLPDPYDGLVEVQQGQPLLVHDCMGISLYLEGQCWGVLTLDALQAGTFSRLTVLELQRFSLLVEAAVRVCQLETELRTVRFARANQVLDSGVYHSPADEIIGQSPQLLQLLSEVKVVASSDLPVLLLGETGVGKELFARYLHQQSNRNNKPLVYINCAALPESLAESELFGHVKGAFSGAQQERSGRFEAADGGTLFLDEVGELPLLVQAKMLRVLQNGEIQRLGSDKSRSVNVRIVAATNRDLAQQVAQGAFRADLYHRLSVYPVPIPPLRQRSSDIAMLAGHFLEQNRSRLGLRSIRLSQDAQLLLLHYHWPGNVRELEHVISRAAIKALSEGHNRSDILTIEPRYLDISPTAAVAGEQNMAAAEQVFSNTLATAKGLPLKQALQQFQRQHIEAAFKQSGGSWSKTARLLEIDSSNLHKLAEKLGVKALLKGQN
ncbi:MAG TPA: nitric oxide reductase transcriptional regulator NorR [Rheinheimera sp.]|uniref:nitric oxide reductase transcriptional regulator NorR n=1 Tax=Rheinheimera sp. TaxID=1869214 RepID=UPI000EDC71C7|nr:nitric oxide reductase transcriptional regulator NorR [Rheinheimera sp.]HCU67050.1 nitric oxide reductase transcriptional regulator NorR [Rheinheimera sp.]